MNSTPSESRTPPPLFIVVSGPSGVGKDALLQRMVERGNPLHVVVTYTTRGRLQGERDGVDYRFLEDEAFRSHIAAGGMLEYALVYDKGYYGVPIAPVRQGLNSGMDTIVRVDVQGARTIRVKVPNAIQVLLKPPSLKVLEERLRRRGRDSEESIQRRLKRAESEMSDLSLFDYVIVNEDNALAAAAEALEAIIVAEHHRSAPRTVSV